MAEPKPPTQMEHHQHEDQVSLKMLARFTPFDRSGKIFRGGTGESFHCGISKIGMAAPGSLAARQQVSIWLSSSDASVVVFVVIVSRPASGCG